MKVFLYTYIAAFLYLAVGGGIWYWKNKSDGFFHAAYFVAYAVILIVAIIPIVNVIVAVLSVIEHTTGYAFDLKTKSFRKKDGSNPPPSSDPNEPLK